MKIFLVLGMMTISTSAFIFKKKTYVYLCNGEGSKRYHFTPSCRGLNHCSTKTYKVSIQKAKDLGRTLCGWED